MPPIFFPVTNLAYRIVLNCNYLRALGTLVHGGPLIAFEDAELAQV
jgi:hypothetical protein